MTCNIERVLTPDGFVVLRVCGRIDGTYVATLRESMGKEETTKSGLAIDLTEVTLVSQEVVEALAAAETTGIELRKLSGLSTRMGFSSKGERVMIKIGIIIGSTRPGRKA